MKKRILVVSAHPDDEILGCGGTVAKSVKRGCEAYTLILGEGPFSRYKKADIKKKEKEAKELRKDIRAANKIIGAKDIFLHGFPDNRFDTIALLDIVKAIEDVKADIKPDVIYTHYHSDLNIDHRITYNAVLTACRPVKDESVKEIYSFEIPSSTEWNYPYTFSPNVFVDVSRTIDKKLEALKSYRQEVRRFPHPRSMEAIEVIAKRWGTVVGLDYAEAFEVIRDIR